MSDEAITGAKVLKTTFRQDIGSQIFPERTIRTTVYQGAVANFKALRKMSQESAMFLGQLLSGPFRGDAGRGAEVFQVNFADGCPVVIAGNNDVRSFAQFDNTFVWV